MARWGMPSPKLALRGQRVDPGIATIRNALSYHWGRWLDVQHRCVVPFTSFSVNETLVSGSKSTVWFALDEARPLGFFAGIWTPRWKSVRKVREGETNNDLFAFLTIDPNKEVEAVYPKAMPAILRTAEEVDQWLSAPTIRALELQRPMPDGSLHIVARGPKKDGHGEDSHSEAGLAWRRNPAHAKDERPNSAKWK